MAKTREFFLDIFFKSFLLVFLPFLLIVSLVFLIQLSILSAKINLNATDLIKLFIYLIPEIFLYTIPFSLIAAIANSFGKLSEENELTALFALGYRPFRFVKYLLPSLFLFSILLAVLAFFLYPIMKTEISRFKDKKMAEATLKIEPNKLSQNFGKYHIYVAKKDKNGSYRDIVLFDNTQKGTYRLFVAKKADIKNDKKSISMSLYQGLGETSSKDSVKVLRYKDLKLHKYPSSRLKRYPTLKEYWEKAKIDKKRRGKFLYYMLISLSPLIALPFIMSLSIYNPRYEKSRTSWIILSTALLVYIPSAFLQKSGSISLFLFSVAGIFILGIFLFYKRVLRFY